jgi:hypothetical protein
MLIGEKSPLDRIDSSMTCHFADVCGEKAGRDVRAPSSYFIVFTFNN